MRVLIIGLGIYGANLAVDLTSMGHEVIGADRNASIVESIKDKISTAYILDAIDEASVSVLPVEASDLVIVAIGEDFGASIKSVALMRKMGAKRLYARAADDLHETILRGFHVDRILVPEQRAALELTRELALGAPVEAMAIDGENYVMKFPVPDTLVGLTVDEVGFERTFGMKFIALARATECRNVLGLVDCRDTIVADADGSTTLQASDILTLLGTRAQYRRLLRHTR